MQVGNNCWALYTLMRQIMDIICAPYVDRQETDLLRVLIKEYLTTRVQLFPHSSLKNKHHHLVHYPRLIEESGPLSRFWCLRFEAKHQRPKKLMHLSGNFQNVPKSIASRHQLDMAYSILYDRSNSSSCTMADLSVGPGHHVTLSELSEGSDLNELLGSVGLHTELLQARWVELKGIRYKPGCMLVTKVDGELPSFQHVTDILVYDSRFVWMVGYAMETLSFDCHFNARSVHDRWPRRRVYCEPVNLVYPFPTTCFEKSDNSGEILICLKYRV